MAGPVTSDDHIPDREALSAFLRRLRIDFEENGAEWENRTLDGFLEALGAWVSDAPGWYANRGEELPAKGDWTFIARALSAARIYE
ncbi:hypothetical protein ABZ471_24825 [Streptomyces sp. NPDC005728]|uniref:DUF7660 family protein n=1 Tax=Streptomyces sp. NPDC005728 TaxID=3157054 RepID=UPI00340276B2